MLIRVIHAELLFGAEIHEYSKRDSPASKSADISIDGPCFARCKYYKWELPLRGLGLFLAELFVSIVTTRQSMKYRDTRCRQNISPPDISILALMPGGPLSPRIRKSNAEIAIKYSVRWVSNRFRAYFYAMHQFSRNASRPFISTASIAIILLYAG